MAVKPTRTIIAERVDCLATSTGLAGSIWSYGATGVANWGDSKVTIYNDPSGKKAVGLCYWDVVKVDMDNGTFPNLLGGAQTINPIIGTSTFNGKITLITKGTVVTDRIVGTPTLGAQAYLGGTGCIGLLADVSSGYGTTDTTVVQKVGRFESIKDADGFVKVSLDL
jgi:hypothetical protein